MRLFLSLRYGCVRIDFVSGMFSPVSIMFMACTHWHSWIEIQCLESSESLGQSPWNTVQSPLLIILLFITSKSSCELIRVELRGVKQPTNSSCESRDKARGGEASRCRIDRSSHLCFVRFETMLLGRDKHCKSWMTLYNFENARSIFERWGRVRC
jgi:hypothetical protein